MINDDGQSDSCIVPGKTANKAVPEATAEQMEGRRLIKGNVDESAMSGTQGRKEDVQETPKRIRQAVGGEPKQRMTSLYHHVYRVENLREAYMRLKEIFRSVSTARPVVFGIKREAAMDETNGGTPKENACSLLDMPRCDPQRSNSSRMEDKLESRVR